MGAGEIRTVGFVWSQFRGHSLALGHAQNWARGYRKEKQAWPETPQKSIAQLAGWAVCDSEKYVMSSFSRSLPEASFFIWIFAVNREKQM